jgi:nitrogen fixation protein NifB
VGQNVIPLGSIKIGNGRDALQAELKSQDGGCSTSGSCGSSQGADELPTEIWEKVKDHPCYSEEAHHYFARMHVAVAPACNIQCNYCNRKYDCANESRPGVVSERLTPDMAARKVIAVANEVPQLSVLGIAGPGDSCYDWRKTKETFDLIVKELPDIKLCLSTNGLMLPDHVDEIADMNIDHVTITINMVDPEVGARIYPWIFYKHKRWTGLDAAKILHERQMEGLEMLTSRKILTKVNSVMIPGINDEHLKEVNKWVKARGAFLHNIMPLISAPEHGTYFGLTGQRGPRAAELKALQDACAGGANLMRHCRQCRADAVGLLGEDRGQEFTLDKIPEEVAYDSTKRDAYREWVEVERADRRKAAAEAGTAAAKAAASAEAAQPLLVAVCTKGGGRVNQHFGHAKEFQIFEVDADGAHFVGHRRADNYCVGGVGDDEKLATVIRALEGVPVVLCAKIGDCPKADLEKAGVEAIDAYAFEYIETAAAAVFAARAAASRAASAPEALTA